MDVHNGSRSYKDTLSAGVALSAHKSILTIAALPIELLISIFQWVLWNPIETLDGARESQYARIALASVSTLWQDVVYHTPSLWTTIYGLGTGQRTTLALNKSQNLPLDVYVDLPSWEGPDSLDLFTDICAHINRWRVADIIVPPAEYLDAHLVGSAPLLEKLAIMVDIEEETGNPIDPFDGDTPCLRSVLLSNIAVPWNSPMLSELQDLKLRNIIYGSQLPTVVEALTVLAACPRLSVLHIHCTEFALDPQSSSLPFVHLLYLREIRLLWLVALDVRNFLTRIHLPSCDIVQVVCVIMEETSLSTLPTISASIFSDTPGGLDVSLTVGPRAAMYRVHQSTHQSRQLQAVAYPRDTTIQTTSIVQHLVSALPPSSLIEDTDFIFYRRFPHSPKRPHPTNPRGHRQNTHRDSDDTNLIYRPRLRGPQTIV